MFKIRSNTNDQNGARRYRFGGKTLYIVRVMMLHIMIAMAQTSMPKMEKVACAGVTEVRMI